MKRLADYLLINEVVLVADNVEGKGMANKIGRVISVKAGGDDILVEFADLSQGAYRKKELLHLYPKQVIMQGMISNLDIGDKNFKAILKVFKLLSEKRITEALQLAAINDQVKFFCLTDCAKWQDLQLSYREKNHRKLRR